MSVKLLAQLTAVITLVTFGTLYIVEEFSPRELLASEPLYSQPSPLELFMTAIAHRESGGNHTIVNKFGMMGKYQFSRTTLRGLRPYITPIEFLNNRYLQDTVMVLNLRSNNIVLDGIVRKYEGRVVKGVKISRSGLLAAAHLGGAGSVISWFKNASHTGRTDANGTSIRDYMVTFADYPIGKYL